MSTAPATVRYSDSIAELTKALIKFHRTCPKIPKSCRNPFLKSKYADLSTILDIVQPVLNDCELVVQQHPTPDFGLTTILSHASGEWMSSEYRMQPLEAVVEKANASSPAVRAITPQSIGSVITYQRRYALGAILNLNIDDDDDASAAGLQTADKPAVPAGPKKTAQELMAEAAAKVEQAAVQPKAEANAAVDTAHMTSTSTAATTGNDGDSTQAQRDKINDLYAKLSVPPDTQAAILARRGLSVLRSLSAVQADEIIHSLAAKLAESLAAQVDGVATGGSTADQGETAMSVDAPCTVEQVNSIKQALVEWEQTKAGVTAEFVARLNGAGFAKIADMTFAQARDLKQAVDAANITAFFDSMLATAAGG